MMQQTSNDRHGTLSFVDGPTSELYIKVSQGWKEVQLGHLILPFNNQIQQDQTRPFPSSLSRRITNPNQRLLLVALNQPHRGGVGGAQGADRMCQIQARAMGLPQRFYSLLSTATRDLSHRVHPLYSTLPITNLRGDVLFGNWKQLLNGDGGILPRVPIYSFDGRDVLTNPFWPKKHVWHGSTSTGQHVHDRSCEMWRTDDMSVLALTSDLLSGRLLGQETRSCSNSFIVLCLEGYQM